MSMTLTSPSPGDPYAGVLGMEIRAVSPVFSYDASGTMFCVIPQGRTYLEAVGQKLTEQGGLVALYVPMAPELDYNNDPQTYGRVIALVRPLPMPVGHTVANYPALGCFTFNHKTGQQILRWPFGWPCECVFYSPHGGPDLKIAVLGALRQPFWEFASQMHHQGPVMLTSFHHAPLRQHLMREIRHQVALDPKTQLQPF